MPEFAINLPDVDVIEVIENDNSVWFCIQL